MDSPDHVFRIYVKSPQFTISVLLDIINHDNIYFSHLNTGQLYNI